MCTKNESVENCRPNSQPPKHQHMTQILYLILEHVYTRHCKGAGIGTLRKKHHCSLISDDSYDISSHQQLMYWILMTSNIEYK